jgi:hypothetical protein
MERMKRDRSEPIGGCQEFCVIQKRGGELHNGDTKGAIGRIDPGLQEP